MEKKVLTLSVKKEWFDKIVSGEKKEEYREIKPYWENRLVKKSWDNFVGFDKFGRFTVVYGTLEYIPYTHVLFINGYGATAHVSRRKS